MPDGKPVLELFDAYLRVRSPEKLSEHTVRRYRMEAEGVARHISLRLGRPLSRITADDLTRENIRAAFSDYATTGGEDGRGHGKSSMAGTWSTWNGFFNYLVHEAIVEGNPMAAVGKPKLPKGQPKPPDETATTIDTLLVTAGTNRADARRPWPERDLALIATFVSLGIRRDELVKANIGDLGGPPGGLKLRVTGKGSKQRFVPVDDALAGILAEFQRTRLERFPTKNGRLAVTEPLLCNDDGTRLAAHQARYILHKCAEAGGVRSSFQKGAFLHGLRHAAATLLVESGATAMDVKEFLGHDALSSSEVYAKSSAERVREQVQKSPVIGLVRQRAPHPPSTEETA